jgi:hypothetical protein
MEYLNYLGSIITTYARCTLEIKSRSAMAKAAFNKKETLFTSQLNVNLMKKLIHGGAEPTDTFQMVIDNIWKQGKSKRNRL